MVRSFSAVVVFCIIAINIETGFAIECYECSDFICPSSDFPKKNCGNNKICVKIDITDNGSTESARLCVPEINRDCDNIKAYIPNVYNMKGHQSKLKAKLQCNVCESDLCNSSYKVYPTIIPFVMLIIVLLKLS